STRTIHTYRHPESAGVVVAESWRAKESRPHPNAARIWDRVKCRGKFQGLRPQEAPPPARCTGRAPVTQADERLRHDASRVACQFSGNVCHRALVVGLVAKRPRSRYVAPIWPFRFSSSSRNAAANSKSSLLIALLRRFSSPCVDLTAFPWLRG